MLLIIAIVLFLVSPASAVSLNELFPYGPEANDSNVELYNTTGSHLHLPSVVPFLDKFYDQLWIKNNGLFSFLEPGYEFYDLQPFLTLNDSCFLAGYWHQTYGGEPDGMWDKVFYQIYQNPSLSHSAMKVSGKVSDYIRKYFPQQRLFNPKMTIVSTWYYIALEIMYYIPATEGYNGMNATLETRRFNNTFQMVLSTDEDRTFVFYLYHDLQWSDPYQYNVHARAGFHCSERNISETLPYSGTRNIVKLMNESNVNVPGLFAFRVDTEKINNGGCLENSSTFSFRPRMGGQLGSTALSIYGPCFTDQTKIKCRFNSTEIIHGTVINRFRAVCVTPFTSVHGSVPVSVSLDDGQTFISAGTFTYVPLKLGSDEVNIQTENDDNLLNGGQYVTLKWQFSDFVRDTFPKNAKVDIELWKVSLNPQSQLEKDKRPLMLKENWSLNDSVRLQLPRDISNSSVCFIRVVVHANSQIYAGLNTGLLIVRSDPLSSTKLCQDWVAQQSKPLTWNEDGFLPCSQTLQQMRAAGRCCYKVDSHNCWFHQARRGRDEPSAIECYISITSNRHGSGTKCCYGNDSMLITRGLGAGTDHRFQPTVSIVKHLFHDTLSYLQCCVMSIDDDGCQKYRYYRPSRKGSNAQHGNGWAFGDPHFWTLDGTSYTFNGYGEYTYLAISNTTSSPADFNRVYPSFVFMSQIRTAPLVSSNATVIESFAAQSVSATVCRREHRQDQVLILRRGNETLHFEEDINILYFPELTITCLDGKKHSHFSFLWTIGVTIEIRLIKMTSPSKQLVLNVAASVAENFRGRTYGLLGTYDGASNNDLRNRNGTIISSNASLERIHYDFGTTWAINPSQSLFYYESNQSAHYFAEKNRVFIPSFIDPTTATDNSTIRDHCHINITALPSSWNVAQQACYYDLTMTHDITFANISLNTGNEILRIRKDQRNLPSFNSLLPIHMYVKQGEQVNLNISASSDPRFHSVELRALHLPQDATYDRKTGLFKWTAVPGEDYVSIEACDTVTDLKAKYDIQFYVNASYLYSSVGNRYQLNIINFLTLIGIVVLFTQ